MCCPGSTVSSPVAGKSAFAGLWRSRYQPPRIRRVPSGTSGIAARSASENDRSTRCSVRTSFAVRRSMSGRELIGSSDIKTSHRREVPRGTRASSYFAICLLLLRMRRAALEKDIRKSEADRQAMRWQGCRGCGWHGAAGLSRSAGAPGAPPAANGRELQGGEGALRERPAKPGQDPQRRTRSLGRQVTATTIDADRARARYFARLLIALSTNGMQAEEQGRSHWQSSR